MTDQTRVFQTSEEYLNRLTTRNNYRTNLDSIEDGNMVPSATSIRSKPDYFSRSNHLHELPRFNRGANFEKTFNIQNAILRREKLIRRGLSLIILAMTVVFMIYVCEEIHFYRILGNDLPPRHKAGQVLQNVRFILENEPKFPNTKKWWILNRIIDNEYENALIDLLKMYDQDYVRIPFITEEYLKYDFRLEDFPEPDFFHSYEYMNFSKVAKLRTIDYAYHDKNIYAMNNNGGRNAAIAHGKSQPNTRWIFPFDGNCYLTTKAFLEIMSQIEQWGKDYKYFVVPMARLLNNTQLLIGPDIRPQTPEEPQIIFRHDAEEKYNENMRYGRRSKLEMLWRLGVPSPRKMLNKPPVPWESHDAPYFSPPKNKYKMIGWVFRLFSGQASQELHKREASALRAFNRLLAIQDFLDGIDEKIARNVQGFDTNRLFLYDEKALNQARLQYWRGDEEIKEVVEFMLDRADSMSLAAADWYSDYNGLPVDISTKIKFLQLKTDPSPALLEDEKKNEVKVIYHQQKKGDEEVQMKSSDSASIEQDVMLDEEQNSVLISNDTNAENGIESQQSGNSENSNNPNSNETTLSEEKKIEYLGVVKDEFGQYTSTTPVPFPKVSTSELFENITTLAFAHHFSGKVHYSRWAANLIRTFLMSSYGVGEQDDVQVTAYNTDFDAINDEGYNFPHLNKIPRTVPKFNKIGSTFPKDLLETDPSFFLDSCRLLYRVRALTHKEFTELRRFASIWLERLINSPEGVEMSRKPDHRGTLYDLQVTSLAGFVDDMTQPYEIMFVKNLIDEGKISPTQYESATFKFTTLNLQYWMILTRLVQNVGVGLDLWQYTSKDGQRLSRAMMGHLGNHAKRLDDYSLRPLIHIAQAAHQASDTRRGIWHEHGDEHDYFQHFLKNIGGKMKLIDDDSIIDDEIMEKKRIDKSVGLGNRARQRGIPPFWMFGVA
ncbi:4869_t:CDS:2 [Funneliformis geosporum]|uniref:11154_t:CDS:1 n=1 Tax=Funneliformis geosporum TaxID=1117311 RepID=A0A9W4SLL8_9GLOM|nr:4869_t:CDS:2 [Funneliformis geosporum]CAI2172798.1 11154_t:CDS:2 [Funneliformis geosporum]